MAPKKTTATRSFPAPRNLTKNQEIPEESTRAAPVVASPNNSAKKQQQQQQQTPSSSTEIEVGMCNDITSTAKADPIVAADIHRPSTLPSSSSSTSVQGVTRFIVAHESGKLTQYVSLESSSHQSHVTPMNWTGGRDDILFSRVRYFLWNPSVASSSGSTTSFLLIAAATRSGQLLIFNADDLHLITIVQSGGGGIQDLSEVIQFSSTDNTSFFAACADGGVRRFSARTDEYALNHQSSSRTGTSTSLFQREQHQLPASNKSKKITSGNDNDEVDNEDAADTTNNNNRDEQTNDIFSSFTLEVDQQFTRHEKASVALAVSANDAAGLVCFSDDIGNITAHRISQDRKKREFAWSVQLPTGVALRILIDSPSNSVVVGTSVNEVVFIDAILGVFGARFRHHQAPVAALCSSFSSISNTSTIFASGWHDLIRAYSCPTHRLAQGSNNNNNNSKNNNTSLAYDFAPAEAKRQSHYHEIVDMFTCSNSNNTSTNLYSFSKDGTIMQLATKSLNEPHKAVYLDTCNKITAPVAIQGPVVCSFNEETFEIQFFAIRPTAVTPMGVLALRHPWKVRSLTLSRNASFLAVTTDVGVAIYRLTLDVPSNRVVHVSRYFSSFLSSERTLDNFSSAKKMKKTNQKLLGLQLFEMPESVGVEFSENACYVAADGKYIFKIKLDPARAPKNQQQFENKNKISGQRRQRDEQDGSENEKASGEQDEAAQEEKKEEEKRIPRVTRFNVAGLDNKRITFIKLAAACDGQNSLLATFTDGTSQLLLLSFDETTNRKLSSATFQGPRGIITPPYILDRPNTDDEIICYSAETRTHISIPAAKKDGSFAGAKSISAFAPSTFDFAGRLPTSDNKIIAVANTGLHVVDVDTQTSNGRFKSLKDVNTNNNNENNNFNNSNNGKLRVVNSEFFFPETWKIGANSAVSTRNANSKDVALTEEERREQIAAAALSSVAAATAGDLAVASSLEDLKNEKQSRAAIMQSKPTIFVFERNLERVISSLPPMWRIRKFGN